jgi:hypothetical protein
LSKINNEYSERREKDTEKEKKLPLFFYAILIKKHSKRRE